MCVAETFNSSSIAELFVDVCHSFVRVFQETLFGPKDPNKFLDREFEAGTVLVSTRLQSVPAG